MRHALFVAFHFPPEASSSGVLRTLKYTRYLIEYDWRVTVLTVNKEAYEVSDSGLEAQIPPAVRVVRTPYLNTKQHLSLWGRYPALLAIPDCWIGWRFWAVAAGMRVHREDPVDLVYSTSPHATAHLIAGSLAQRTRLPWVADFRDPWYENPPEPGTPRVVHWAARALESNVVHRADRIVASTKRLSQAFANRYPNEPASKFRSIPNGFDEDDFEDSGTSKFGNANRLLMVHAGSINPDFRDPRPLFHALRAAADKGAVDLSRMAIRFVGGGTYCDSTEMQEALSQTGLSGKVQFHPRVPYRDTLRELGRADILLLLQASPDTADLVPAKLYEYLRSQRPVLALVTAGATEEVLGETNGGWVVNPCNRAALCSVVGEAFRAWAEGRLNEKTASMDRLGKFSRRYLTGELAETFDHVLKEHS